MDQSLIFQEIAIAKLGNSEHRSVCIRLNDPSPSSPEDTLIVYDSAGWNSGGMYWERRQDAT